MFEKNKLLGQFDLVGLPPAPRGIPQIEVTFDIDANGIVSVSAKDLGTGKEQSIKITAGQKLSDEEIEKMKKEAEEHAEEDKQRIEKAGTLNEAETIVFQYEKTLKEMGDEVDKKQVEPIQKDIDALKKLLEDKEKNYEAIKKAKDELTEKFQKISEELYKKVAEEQAKQQAAQASNEKPDAKSKGKKKDKVVDAEVVDEKDEEKKK